MASIPSGVDSCQAHSQAHREETAPPSPTTLKPAHKDPFLANMERLYERQASWQRSARETSSGSSSSFTTSPISPSLAGEPMAQIPEASSSNTKRKNKNAAEDDGAGKTKSRKKVAKACLTCQKSHLTCDDVRPCTRCIKKGVGDQCQEGVRKKAKYLFDGDERAPTQTPASREGSASPPTTFLAPLPPTPQLSLLPPQLDSHRAQKPRVSEDIWLSAPAPLVDNDLATGLVAGNGNEGGLDKYWSGGSNSFGNTALTDQYPYTSAAANMEYEMLDSMFDVFPFTDETNSTNNDNSAGFNGLNTNTDNNTTSNFWPGQNVNPSPAPESYFPQMSSINTDAISDAFAPRPYTPHNLRSTSTNGNTPSSESSLMPPSTAPTRVGTTGDIYRTIVKPYDYTEGYHILMQYLTQNFEQAEILRVVRALATFRPSLIALQMPMTEEDEIFVERSFQRTLIVGVPSRHASSETVS
ncbi:hypothetical protein P7C73_g5151, partial [Tremellales sp. Uapishka_1]